MGNLLHLEWHYLIVVDIFLVLLYILQLLLHHILVLILIYRNCHVLRLLLLFLSFLQVQILLTLLRITILASFSFILFHSSCLSPIDNLLCKIAICSFPNLAINLSNICGVNDISGTNIIAVFCFSNTFCINCK